MFRWSESHCAGVTLDQCAIPQVQFMCQSASEHPSQLLARPTSFKSWHAVGGVTAVNLLAKFIVTLGSVSRRSEVTYVAVVITVWHFTWWDDEQLMDEDEGMPWFVIRLLIASQIAIYAPNAEGEKTFSHCCAWRQIYMDTGFHCSTHFV